MHFLVDQDQLDHALTLVTRLISAQNVMPILGGVQLTASHDVVAVQATDLFSVMTVHIPADIDEEGIVVLPAETLANLVHRIPTARIDIQADAATGKAMVRYGRNRTTIHGFGTDTLPEFPPMPDTVNTLVLPPGSLMTIAQQLVFAIGRDESRPILKGIKVEVQPEQAVFVSTDGSRLSYRTITLPEYHGMTGQWVWPAKALMEAARLAGTEHPAQIRFASGFVQVTTEDTILVSRVLEGEYPEYVHIIPQDYVLHVDVELNELRGSIERAALIAREDQDYTLHIHHVPGLLTVEAVAPTVGSVQEYVECRSGGPEMSLIFNATFFMDALKALTDDMVTIDFAGIQSPARIRSAQHPEFFHLILPLRQLVAAH